MNDAPRFPAPDSDVQDIELDDARMLVLDARAGSRVRVLAGSLWLTERGRSVARLLRPRDELHLTAAGPVVLQSAGSTRIEFAQPSRTHARRSLGRIWRRQGNTAHWVVRSLVIALGVAVGAGVPELLARGFQKSSVDSVVAAAAAQRSPAVRL